MTFAMTLAVAFALLQSNIEMAEALLRQRRLAEAQQFADQALAEDATSIRALHLAGRLAIASSDFPRARRAFERAAKLAPDSAETHFMLGFCYYVENDFALAQPVLARAHAMAPRDARTTLFLALTFDGLAQPARAEPLFRKTLELEAQLGRSTAEAHLAYARMLFSSARLDESQTQVSKALKLEAKSREAHYEQARLFFENSRFPDCVREGELALELPGEGVAPRQVHFLLSRAYSRLHDSERAAFHRRQFEALPPRIIR